MQVTRKQHIAKTGIAKPSGGNKQWGIPSTHFVSQSTTTLTINEVRYIPFFVDYPVTLTAHQFEVTTGPASDSNVAIGVYRADSDLQPTGAPLYDSGSIAVATAFTGAKTSGAISVPLQAGAYLIAVNCSVALTLRSIVHAAATVRDGLGTSAFAQRYTVAQAFGAFPTPGTAWTTLSGSTGGFMSSIVWQWTENA